MEAREGRDATAAMTGRPGNLVTGRRPRKMGTQLADRGNSRNCLDKLKI